MLYGVSDRTSIYWEYLQNSVPRISQQSVSTIGFKDRSITESQIPIDADLLQESTEDFSWPASPPPPIKSNSTLIPESQGSSNPDLDPNLLQLDLSLNPILCDSTTRLRLTR